MTKAGVTSNKQIIYIHIKSVWNYIYQPYFQLLMALLLNKLQEQDKQTATENIKLEIKPIWLCTSSKTSAQQLKTQNP